MISQIVRKHSIRFMQVLFALGALCGQAVAAENTWPKSLDFDLGVIQLYEPEIEKIDGNGVDALAALAIKMGGPGPVFAAISFSAITESAPDAATITLHDIQLTGLHFGEGVDQHPNELVAALEQELGDLTLTIEQTHRSAGPGADHQISGQGVKSEPINILFRTSASVLVALDGDPKLQPIENSDLAWVANSTFPMLYQRGSYYLLIGGESGYRSTDPQGPWTQVAELPANIRNLFSQAGPDSPELNLPQFENPDIIVTTEPTELLVSEGIPAWAPLAGMQLLYMTNTNNDIFLDLESGRHYVLLQGRWYAGLLDKSGTSWLPVANDELPAPFADIDVSSPKSHILAFVDGTPQAQAALLENTLPQGKAVSRDDTSFVPEWDGEPRFEPVEQSSGLEYAINTPDSVFRVGDRYYACEDGVWYESTSAFGPWWIAAEVPDIIYEIPASNPQHRVTYARIYDVTPDVVYVGYTPGYLNYYDYHGSVVFGSGWRYQPWYGSHYYSHHYSHYWGWGYQSHYTPWLAWAYVDAVYWPRHYSHNRHHYRNNRYNRSWHRRSARHHNDHGNNHWRDNDDRGHRGHKGGRNRANRNHDDYQTAANSRDRSARSNSRDRNRNRINDRPNTRNSAQITARNNARNNARINARDTVRNDRARSDVAVTKNQQGYAATNTPNRVKRGRYQTSDRPQVQVSRPDRDRTERPRNASSVRRGAVANSYANSGQHRSRPISTIRVPDQTSRSAARPSRPVATQPVAITNNKTNSKANNHARSPEVGSKPPRQRSEGSQNRSHNRGNASRSGGEGRRRHR